MAILEYIKNWIKKRKAKKAEEAFKYGYEWAKEEILVNCQSEDFVEGYIWDSNHPFDKGAAAFLRDMANDREIILGE